MPSVTEDTPWDSLKNTTAGQRHLRTWCPVVAVVGKLSRVQVDAVRPILLLASGKERNKLLVPPFACHSKAAHISAAGQKRGDRVRRELACPLVDHE